MVDHIAIESWCSRGVLPSEDEFFSALVEDEGIFTSVEGQYWDFKSEWPFSYSDPYFGGICRLICAFANTSGGLIVFGVSDDTREGGKNKVRPNLDKLQLSFRQLTGRTFDYDFQTLGINRKPGPVDVLLVKPRPRSSRPLCFRKNIANYEAGTIWVRSANEVIRAQPQHYASLFLDENSEGIDGSIPPSSAQIKRFIGRAGAMTELFDWLQNSDEPRTYLHGKGGSGKTTIAREFARLVKSTGGRLIIDGQDKVEVVIFVSAKEKELISVDAEIVGVSEPDFFDETTLLRKIIDLSGGGADVEGLDLSDIRGYRSILTRYFDAFSYLLVIDDIDTLTTKGIDPGADFLYKSLSRAKKRSKLLYTIRNAPSQSLHNSIEVPGLIGVEYEEFVDECITRFKAPNMESEFRKNKLPLLSERRPLVIESIIALSRTSGGYSGAERLFGQNVGDNIRDYVFAREWDALSDGLERPLLAALADLNRPANFDDLKIILQASDSTVRDAIGGVREMFLVVDDAGANTLYSLAPLTRAFVNSRKVQLKLYPAVKKRVQSFVKSIKTSPQEVVRIVYRVRSLVPLKFSNHSHENLRLAASIVRDTKLPENVTEDPLFRASKGYVEAIQSRVEMQTVRGDFLYALQMKHEPEFEELMAWFEAEKNSTVLEEHLFKIVDTVISGRKYTEDQKVGMISRKATTNYAFAKQRLETDPEQSLNNFRESLLLHLKAFKLNVLSGSPMRNVSEKYARDTCYQWIPLLFENEKSRPLQDFYNVEKDCEGYLDPIFEPMNVYLRKVERIGWFQAEKSRMHNQARIFLAHKFNKEKWIDWNKMELILSSVSLVAAAAKPAKEK